jgi:hypothetical protein
LLYRSGMGAGVRLFFRAVQARLNYLFDGSIDL